MGERRIRSERHSDKRYDYDEARYSSNSKQYPNASRDIQGSRRYIENQQYSQNRKNNKKRGTIASPWLMWAMLFILPPFGIFLLWKYEGVQKKQLKIIISVVFGTWAIILLAVLFAPKVDIPAYEINGSRRYVRDGQECIAYHVIVDSGVEDAALKYIFSEVIENDGFYLHTAWFYSDASLSDSGYDIAMMQEEEKGQEPVLTKAQ